MQWLMAGRSEGLSLGCSAWVPAASRPSFVDGVGPDGIELVVRLMMCGRRVDRHAVPNDSRSSVPGPPDDRRDHPIPQRRPAPLHLPNPAPALSAFTDSRNGHNVRARDDVTRALLLAAAGRVLDESPADFTVRKLASEADMSTMNIYSRFGSLSGLIDDLVLEGFDGLTQVLISVALTGDAVADLIESARVYRSWVLARPARYRLMMTSCRVDYEPSLPVVAARRDLVDTIIQRVGVARAVRVDLNDVAPFTTNDAATIVLSLLHGMILLELDGLLDQDNSTTWTERFGTMIQFAIQPATEPAA